MGTLQIYVHNSSNGRPAIGMWVEVYRRNDDIAELLVTATTNADGGSDEPLAYGALLTAGIYRLILHVGDYFANIGTLDARACFINLPIEFAVHDPAMHHHVSIYVSPWNYSVFVRLSERRD